MKLAVHNALADAVAAIEAAPESQQALLLYALISTLAVEKAGCMFKLTKLREMDADTRQLAYGLMEFMARGQNRGEPWEQALARIEHAIRGA